MVTEPSSRRSSEKSSLGTEEAKEIVAEPAGNVSNLDMGLRDRGDRSQRREIVRKRDRGHRRRQRRDCSRCFDLTGSPTAWARTRKMVDMLRAAVHHGLEVMQCKSMGGSQVGKHVIETSKAVARARELTDAKLVVPTTEGR
jgi:hypothetical protein